MSARFRPSMTFDRFAGIYLWLTFVVVFGVWKPGLFLTMSTLHSVASANAPTALLGLAVLIPLCAGAYDLSAGATMNFATVVAVLLQTDAHMSMVPAIVCTVGIGVLIGAINGLVVVRFKVNSFIATLGMSSVVLAFQTMIVGGTQPIPPSSPAWPELTTRTIFGFQIIVVYMLVIAVLVWWLLTRMTAGRYIYAVGGNAEAARLAGVPVGRHVYLSFALWSHLRRRWSVLRIALRPVADLRFRTAAAGLRCGLPGLGPAARKVQRVGDRGSRLHSGDRYPGTSVRDQRPMAR